MNTKRTVPVLACTMLAAAPLAAETSYWINPGVGDWMDGSNWSSGSLVGTPIIDNGGTAQLQALDSPSSLIIGESTTGSGTLEIIADGFMTSAGSSGNGFRIGLAGQGTLNLMDGGTLWTSTWEASIGTETGSVGEFNIDDGEYVQYSLQPFGLAVGEDGIGTLNVFGGGSFTYHTDVDQYSPDVDHHIDVVLGRAIGSQGTLNVTGAGSMFLLNSRVQNEPGPPFTPFVNNGNLSVGESGEGAMNITGGGTVEIGGRTILGRQVTGVGTVNVQGAGSTWNAVTTLSASEVYPDTGSVQDTVIIGDRGVGTLNITDGGTVMSFRLDGVDPQGLYVSVGHRPDSIGTALVDGADSSWTISNAAMKVGNDGQGTLEVVNGASVLVRVNTSLALPNFIVGHGWLTQSAETEGVGEVIIDGPGSTLTTINTTSHSHYTTIGGFGMGTMTVSGGGVANLDDVSLGGGLLSYHGSGGTGALIVEDAGSIVHCNAMTIGGREGTGTAIVRNGGAIDNGNSAIEVGRSNTSGTLNIGDGDEAGFVDAPSVTAGAGNATLNFNHNETNYFFTSDGTTDGDAASIEGDMAVNHIGPGTTLLTGTHTYTGPTTVDNGTLLVAAAPFLGFVTDSTFTVNAGGTFGGGGFVGPVVVQGGTVAPGANGAGTLAVSGGLTLNSDSVLEYELDGLIDSNDTMNVNGDVILDGTINITNLGGLEEGSYDLINYGIGALTDNGLTVGSAPDGFAFAIDTSTPGTVILNVEPYATCPADLSDPTDGVVNVFDLLELLANWGGNGPGADIAEPNDVVDVFDLLELLANWGACA